MKKHARLIYVLSLIGCALSASLQVYARQLPAGDKERSYMGIGVEDIYKTDACSLAVQLSLDLSKVDMKSQYEQVFTPYIYNGTDTARFESFAVIGRKRLISNERNNRLVPVTFYKGILQPSLLPHPGMEITPAGLANYNLLLTTPWQPWMESAVFGVDSEVRGCADCIKDVDYTEPFPMAQTDFVQRYYFPEFLYVTPVAEAVKMREISARAYIDFPVNRTEIYPDYRRNPQELAKIRATIDSVKNDKDISITSLHISGTASPEGSYQNNVRLASGRTESLKNYVQGLYKFPKGLITTSFEPVDWQGLAQFLAPVAGAEGRVNAMDSIRIDQFTNIPGYNADSSLALATWSEALPHAGEILDIVNSNIEPYARNHKIRQTYPKEYDWLLKNVYPALRHSDYRIQFEIKTFTEVSEILEIMETQPQKLSLAELFVAANSQPEGSELYNKAFEIAVTMYPDDATANLNAAVAAMKRGDKVMARRYLSRIKNPVPESEYAGAMLLLMEGDEPNALEIFRKLSVSGNAAVAEKASQALQGLEEVAKANATNFILITE